MEVSKPHPSSPPWVGRRSFRCLRPLVFLGLAAVEAAAQTPPSMTIGEAIRSQANHYPAHLGETVVISGVMTDEPHDVGSGSSLANLQDPTGGSRSLGPMQCFRRGVWSGATWWRSAASCRSTGNGRGANRIHRSNRQHRVWCPGEASAVQLRGEALSGRLVQAERADHSPA